MFWIFGGLEFRLSSDELLGSIQGLPIAGQFVKYGRWLLMQRVQEAKPVKQLLVRAWEFKTKITLNLKGTNLSDGLKKIWVQTFEVREEGSSIGPFWSEAEVTQKPGSDQLVPTLKLVVHQMNKVRGCDSATV